MQLLVSVTGSQKVTMPMTIAMSGIAKMFVGEIVETGITFVCFLSSLSLKACFGIYELP